MKRYRLNWLNGVKNLKINNKLKINNYEKKLILIACTIFRGSRL